MIAWAQGCAMCGTALGGDDARAAAFNWSIVFMMAMPYLLFAGIAGWLFVSHRRAARRRHAAVLPLRGRGASA